MGWSHAPKAPGLGGAGVRQGALGVMRRFPRRLKDHHFWYVQAAFAVITALHILTELPPYAAHLRPLHDSAVTLYLVPIAFASLRYGWEGGLATGVWAGILALPNVLLWHRADFAWVGDVVKMMVVVLVGTVLAWRVEVEAGLRRRAEEASRELAVSEAEYRNLFENAADAILVLDAQGRIVSVNPAATTLTGYNPDELVGMHMGRLVDDESAAQLAAPGHHHDGATGVQQPPPLALRRKDGGVVFVDVAATPLPPGVGSRRTQAIMRDVTAQRQRELGLRSFLQQVTRAQEEERKRIARELHDDTAQTIALLRRELDEALRIEGPFDGEAAARVAHARDLATQTLLGVRRFSQDLRPPMLDDLGLVAALEALVTEIAAQEDVAARLEVEGGIQRLDPEVELTLYRVAQEALRNAGKHARASTILARLEFQPDAVRLTVQDDGRGFDAQALLESNPAERGCLGLVGMQERAGLLGADLTIESTPGVGTHVTMTYRRRALAGAHLVSDPPQR